MGTKLNTRGEMESTPLLQVKEKAGQTFTGRMLAHRTAETGYGIKDIFELAVVDGDMATVKKVGDDYKPVDVKVGERVSIFAPTRLAYALSQVEVGQTVKITYLGLGKRPKKGGNPPHEYEVELV